MLPTKFQSTNWPFGSGKEVKNIQDGHHGGHLGFTIGKDFSYFNLQVTLMLPTKFQVNWPFSLEEAKNSFSRWPPVMEAILDFRME